MSKNEPKIIIRLAGTAYVMAEPRGAVPNGFCVHLAQLVSSLPSNPTFPGSIPSARILGLATQTLRQLKLAVFFYIGPRPLLPPREGGVLSLTTFGTNLTGGRFFIRFLFIIVLWNSSREKGVDFF